MSLRRRRLVVRIPAAAAAAAAGLLAACGGQPKTPPKIAVPDAGSAPSGATFVASPPPSGLPAMAAMPPSGVAGSKKAKPRPDPALGACSTSFAMHAKDPSDQVKRIGDACSGPSKMKPLGSPFRGQQGDRDAHQENKFHADANRCYRVYFAGDEAVRDIVIILRDSAGDIIAEGPGPAVPSEGAACFSSADDVTVLVGVGSGKGQWSAQVWGD
jgi:hypothetical protein